MKKSYYTEHNINTKASEFLKKISSLRSKHQIKIDPKTAALLVIDAQKFFFHHSSHAYVPSSDAITSRIVDLQKHCLGHNILAIQTRHKEDSNSLLQKWWGRDTISEEMSEIDARIRNAAIKVIDKTEYDAFHNTNLDGILKSLGITQVIITGVMTHLCCETTARSAFVRGYEVFFSIDGTATHNQEFHLATLINLAHGFAIPMLTSEIIEALDAK